MLPRAASRALRPSPCLRPTASVATGFRIRTYARDGKPPVQQPRLNTRPSPKPREHKPAAATGAARQTSPGTALPNDQTWKPTDSINFAGAHAGPAPSRPQAGRVHMAPRQLEAQRLDRDKPVPGSARDVSHDAQAASEQSETLSSMDNDSTPLEPAAQHGHADEPVQGSLRDTAHRAQAASENESQPAEASSQPLPDLRQGIPSTFDMEFGQSAQQPPHPDRPSEQTEGVDLTTPPPTPRYPSGRDRSDEQRDRSAYETSLDRRRAKVANYGFVSLIVLSTIASLYLARPFDEKEEIPTGFEPAQSTDWTPASMFARVRARLGGQLGYYTEPTFPKLLPEVPETQRPPYTLVLSLEDLLVHSTWTREHGYRTAKRPGVDYFIRYLSQYYELVLFTSVPLSIADPVVRKLDPFHFIMWPLGREATKYERGEYVKDLAYLNRPLSKTLIIDTHAPHVAHQPENAILLPKWAGDGRDPRANDLVALIPFLEHLACMAIDDVRPVLASFAPAADIPVEFAAREARAREVFEAQLAAQQARAPKRSSLGALFGGAGGLGITADRAGQMVMEDGQSVAEGALRGKMLGDQIRERGLRQYEAQEREIRKNGAQWLREEEEEFKRAQEAQVRDMKTSAWSWFGRGKGE